MSDDPVPTCQTCGKVGERWTMRAEGGRAEVYLWVNLDPIRCPGCRAAYEATSWPILEDSSEEDQTWRTVYDSAVPVGWIPNRYWPHPTGREPAIEVRRRRPEPDATADN